MKAKMIRGFLVLSLAFFAGIPGVCAEGDDSIITEEGQAGAAGSAGEFQEVFTEDDAGASDPSQFEGDSDNTPGERAPEELPMDDAPVDAGMGVAI